MARFVFIAAILAVTMVSVSSPANAEQKQAVAVIERFHANLLTVMKEADALGIQGRYDDLEAPIKQTFHLPLMIRIATGSYWKRATTAQKQALVDAFTRLSIATYADRFDGYTGEGFETAGTRAGPGRTLVIKTRILRPNDSAVEISYIMKVTRGEWRIVDVLLDDTVSELAVKRSEYRRILKSTGVNGLIDTISAKANQLVSG